MLQIILTDSIYFTIHLFKAVGWREKYIQNIP